MPRIATPDTLEVGNMVGTGSSNLFIRAFQKHEDEVSLSISHVLHWNGSDFRLLRTFDVEIVDIALQPDGRLFALTQTGILHAFDGATWSELCVEVSPLQRVSALRLIGDRVFALGANSTVFELVGKDWVAIGLGLSRVGVRDLVLGSDGNLWFCATKGGFGSIDPSRNVTVVSLETNANLLSIWPQAAGLLICGAQSSFFRFLGDEISLLEDPEGPRTLSRFALWQSKLLIAGTKSILQFVSDTLEPWAQRQSFRLVAFSDTLFNQSIDRVEMLSDGQWKDFPVWVDLDGKSTAQALLKR